MVESHFELNIVIEYLYKKLKNILVEFLQFNLFKILVSYFFFIFYSFYLSKIQNSLMQDKLKGKGSV